MVRKLFAILLICLGGCVSRNQYLRDHLQDSQDKQEQRKFNAEVLRELDWVKRYSGNGQADAFDKIYELQHRIEALEKKMDERKEPITFNDIYVTTKTYPGNYQERPNEPCPSGRHWSDLVNDCISTMTERPNFPCPYCDHEKQKVFISTQEIKVEPAEKFGWQKRKP